MRRYASSHAAARGRTTIDALWIARTACEAAEARKAVDVLLLDVRELTIIADYFVIAAGTSGIHVKAIADAISGELEDRGVLPQHREGTPEAGWMILDYADTVVHVFHVREREYYDLERLYRGARVVGGPAAEAGEEIRTDCRS